MSLTILLRSALIALTIAQAVFLPRGGCCCSAERLMAMVGGNHSDLPTCCRVADANNEDGNPDKADPVDHSEPVQGKCQCVTLDCCGPQSQSPVTPEMTSHERLDHWVASQPVLTVAIVSPPPLPAPVHDDWGMSRLGSGHDARIVLQSWRC
jgi:hypothetical protein